MTAVVTKEMKLRNCKRNAIKISQELLYGEATVRQIRKAATEDEIVRILITARRESFR